MRRILLAVDDSEGAKRAADFVEEVLSSAEVTVTALHVARKPVRTIPSAYTGLFAWPMRGLVESAPDDEEAVRVEIVAGAMTAVQAPTADHIRVAFGDSAAVISKVADDQDADLIVVGHSSRGILRRLLHRSVAETLVRKSSRAVLVVR